MRHPFKASLANSKGATLVEMLVTFVVVAFLMALMLPAFSRLRQKAGAQQCLSNLRQIGLGMMTYAQDNRVYPYYISNVTLWSDGSDAPASFFAGPYLKATACRTPVSSPARSAGKGGLFDCPVIGSAEKERRGGGTWPTDYFDYAVNLSMCGRPPVSIGAPSRTILLTEGGHTGRIKARWTDGLTYTPAQSMNPGGTAWDYTPSPLIAVHGGEAHFFFVDGHIGRHAPSEPNETWYNGHQ